MVEANRVAIGIDVSDKTAQVCVLRASGQMDEVKIALKADALHAMVPFVPPTEGVVVFETGTRSAWLKRLFEKRGMRCIVADARKLAAISQSPTKTDRNDARTLARLGLADDWMRLSGQDREGRLLHDTYVRPVAHQEIYDSLRTRDQLVRRRGDLIREVRTIVKGRGGALPGGTARTFRERCGELPAGLFTIVCPVLDVIDAFTRSIDEIEVRLEVIANELPEVQRLTEVSGVGIITSLAFYAVIGDPARFERSRDVGAYLGLVPRRDQSGELDRACGITKCGNPLMRRLLVQCANQILGHWGKPSALRTWGLAYMERRGRRGNKAARIGVARRLAVVLHSMWKTGQAWNPFPTPPAPPEATSGPVGRDDCAGAAEPPELAKSAIAASPTASTQPCAHLPEVRTNERAERRRTPSGAAQTAGVAAAPKEARPRAGQTPPASADGERGCPQPGAGVAPPPGPGTPARPRAHMDAPQKKTGGPPRLNQVGPPPPPAKRPARPRKDRPPTVDGEAAS